MKKLNKKGFTLAELLIVIAIIAILIAIAIPAFGTALDNARLQTDHANMRSAYAIAQVANLQGYIECDGNIYKPGDATYDLDTSFSAYFGADGSVTKTIGDAYVTSVTPKSDGSQCTSSAFCTSGGPDTTKKTATGAAIKHEKDKVITFTLTDGNITLGLGASTSTPSPAGP